MDADDRRRKTRDEEEDGAASSDEEGIDLMNSEGDSSEEESEDPEEEARIREGFITDEDEGEEGERKRRKKTKRKHREREFEALSEDDLDLVEQNTGVRIARPEGRKAKKLKRAGAASDESEDDQRAPDVADLFDERRDKAKGKSRASDNLDMRLRANQVFDEDEDDMADFIEEDSPDEEDRERDDRQARKRREKERKSQRRAEGFALSNLDITAEAWDEIQEVFGDGHDYDEAFEQDDEDEPKVQPTMQDVFEPSEIAERMMTGEDDIIRAIDIPERMQIAQAGIEARTSLPAVSDAETEADDVLLKASELVAAASWCASRISDDLTKEFIQAPDGSIPALRDVFLSAVQRVLHFLCVDYFEVPFIWVHRRDYFIHHDPNSYDPATRSKALLAREDLWKIYSLAVKYRALLDKKGHLFKLWQKLQKEDDYFNDAFNSIDSPEEAADLVEWVTMKYQTQLKELSRAAGAEYIAEGESDEVNNRLPSSKFKRATGASRYEMAKNSLVSKFAEKIAVPAETLAQDFIAGVKQSFMDDPPSGPDAFAETFIDPTSTFLDAESVIAGAKAILINEIAKEASLRKEVRKTFRTFGAVTVRPTEKGLQVIDDLHPYHSFKYLLDKPIEPFVTSAQFLQILAAEAEGLVMVDIHVQKESLRKLTQEFYNVYLSDLTSADATAWNKIREEVIMEMLQQHLLPLGARWTREWLKEVEEDFISARCAARLEERIEVAPYQVKGQEKGDVPRVLAISQGRGDPKRDWIHMVMVNKRGRFINHDQLFDLQLGDTKEALKQYIVKFKPDVIVIGGFTPATLRLQYQVRQTIAEIEKDRQKPFSEDSDVNAEDQQEAADKASIQCIYVHDDVARLFQNSKRATTEFGELALVARYCLGLARYVQSPLCEFASLGRDLTAITYDVNQRLVPTAKLLPALESALVNVVNLVGVDINRAMRDPYYAVLLPYVAGLGPRKASGMIRRIGTASEGTLISRADLVKRDICTSRIFMNCVAFLKIPAEDDLDEDSPYDVLDGTRIHVEDYHIARKMAADAEEMDEEDLEDLAHPSGAVRQLMENGAGKLDELSLDDFATALYETQHLRKRITLYMIRDELQSPYAERRSDFRLPTNPEIFTMLTGETRQTLNLGMVVPVKIVRILTDGRLICRLDSGIEGVAKPDFLEQDVSYQVGQTVQAQVISFSMTFNQPTVEKADSMSVELSMLRESVSTNGSDVRKVVADRYYDVNQEQIDKQALEAKTKRTQGRQRRVVNHPNFHNFNAGQAEQYLANMQRGDCVVRPSSRGVDHLAVTWKVDDGVYQHIDVLELDKPNEYSLGRNLRIQGKYTYSDLDELIVSHVRSMARKVDEMMHSDKYKGTEADLRKWLNTSIMAEPTRSFYGFALDTRKPGNFILSFLTKGYEIQNWSVTVEPEAFILQGNSDPAPNVTMLCNAFKSTYVTKMALAGGNAAGIAARTPYVGGRTPNPYAGGGMTPYGMAGLPSRPAAAGAYVHPSRMQQAGSGHR